MNNNRFNFRVWYSQYSRMHYAGDGYLQEVYFDGKPWNNPASTAMQYTSLKDKNGKDIYEGDIVNVNSRNHVIEWRGSGFYCTGSEYALNTIWFAGGEPVVVGNIFEHPELIQKIS